MTTEKYLEVGKQIEIIMNSEGKMLPPFVAHGRVKRCVADTENRTLHHIAVELSETQ